MRIAVATDFSEQAERARDAAVALAWRLRASITLIHTMQPYPDESQASASEVEGRLERMAEELRRRGVSVETEIVIGYAEESIAGAAQRAGAGLLVVGSHGRRAPLRWILGSVAERTLQSSEVPVLVVGVAGGGFSAWAESSQPLRVTVALESAEAVDPILEMARLLASADGCELTFVHVVPRALLAGRLPAILQQAFRERLAGLGGNFEMVADGDSLAGSLAAYLGGHGCDFAVVGAHSRTGFETAGTAEVARALLRHRVAPVLAVPLPPASASVQAAPTLHSILAATDLSELGDRAVAHAYAIARGGTVTLLYVHVTPKGMPVLLEPELRADRELRLLALVPPDARLRGISTNVVIVEADKPAQAIVDAATRLGCEVICMGSTGARCSAARSWVRWRKKSCTAFPKR